MDREASAGQGNGVWPIVILAVEGEVEPVLRRVREPAREPAGPFPVWRARHAGRELLIGACRIGKVNAALATQALVERYHPRALLSCGSAGSLCPEVARGDLVIATGAMQHDAGLHLGRQFRHIGTQVQHNGGVRTQRVLQADPVLVAAAQAAAEGFAANGQPVHVHSGIVATGDQVLFSTERRASIRQGCDALAVDMESAAVAQAAQANGIPWLAVRGISDDADEEAGLDFSQLVDYVEDGPAAAGWARAQARRLAYLVGNPTAIGKLGRLRAGIRLAADLAAALTFALIERL